MNKFLENITNCLSLIAGMLMMSMPLLDCYKQEEMTLGLIMLYVTLWSSGFGMIKLTFKQWI